jgi:hypothetical protein
MLDETLEAKQMRQLAALQKRFETIIQFLPSEMAEPIKELVDYLDCLLEFSREDLDKSRDAYRALTDKVHALIDCIPCATGSKAFALPDTPQGRSILKTLGQSVSRY